MMNSSWNLQGDASQYKEYAKSWTNKDQGSPHKNLSNKPQTSGGYRAENKDPDGNPTIKSGMVSQDNPFGTLGKYYEGHYAQRQSLANNKHIADPKREYKQITGVVSANNPFTSNIGNTYTSHVSQTQQQIVMPKPYGNAAVKAQNDMYLSKFKDILYKRGTKGLVGLKKQFKIMDADGSGELSFSEFNDAL